MSSTDAPQPLAPGVAGRVAAALVLVVAGFQGALALGAPWGRAAWGGAHPGQLPSELRVASALSLVVYLGVAAVAGTSWLPPAVRRRVLVAGSILMVAGTAMNLASPSPVERALWAPVAAALAIALGSASRTIPRPTVDHVGSPNRGS